MQTNFEKVKQAIFNEIKNSPNFAFTFMGGEFKSFHTKYKKGLNELNSLLDRIDIRSVSTIVSQHPELNLPTWIKRSQFVIDYNKKGELDLIKNVA